MILIFPLGIHNRRVVYSNLGHLFVPGILFQYLFMLFLEHVAFNVTVGTRWAILD